MSNGVQFNFDASNVKPAAPMGAIPEGWYKVAVSESSHKPSASSQGASYIEFQFTILDGEYKGRKLFDRANVQNANPQAVEIGYAKISAICHATGHVRIQQSTAELHGMPLMVRVSHRPARTENVTDPMTGAVTQKSYPATNDVQEYATATGQPLAGGSAPSNAPAWAGTTNAPLPQAPAMPAPQQQGPQGAPTWAPPQQSPAAPMGPPQAPAPSLPPAPVAGPQMTAKANGMAYEQFTQRGWTDAQLISEGYMLAPTPAAPTAPPTPPSAPVAPPPAWSPPGPSAPMGPPTPVPQAGGNAPPPWLQR